MSKINLTDLSTITGNETSAINTINNNSTLIETFSDNTLSRDGTTPNHMLDDLDMNSNSILNLPPPASATEPLRLQDLSDFIGSGSIVAGAPTNASYLTLGANPTLINERVLTAGLGISFVDGGVGSTLTVSSNNIFNVSDFGAIGNGITDDSSAIQSAITAAFTAGAGMVYFDALEYAIGTTITVGNGSSAALSTQNGLALIGCGAPFLRLKDGTPTILRQSGTRFKWIGASGGTMLSIAGPCFGNDVRNIALNGNNLADYCLVLTSSNRGFFPSITISNFLNTGVKLTTVAVESIGGVTEGLSSASNRFDDLEVDAKNGTVCVACNGYLGSAANGWNSTRNYFRDTYLLIRTGCTGFRFTFADQIVVDGLIMSSFNADGTEAAIKFVGCLTSPSNFAFPQNIKVTGNVDLGGEGSRVPVVNEGAPMHGNIVKEQLCTNEF